MNAYLGINSMLVTLKMAPLKVEHSSVYSLQEDDLYMHYNISYTALVFKSQETNIFSFSLSFSDRIVFTQKLLSIIKSINILSVITADSKHLQNSLRTH